MGTHKKLNYIYVFRAIAIIIIVARHCFKSYQPTLDIFESLFKRWNSFICVYLWIFISVPIR